VSLSDLTARHFKGPRYEFTHITCDLPVDGARVWVRSKAVEGNATIRIHWHYEGCVLDVEMDDGSRRSIHPSFGDDVTPTTEPPTVLSGVVATYKSAGKGEN
jgi:hypothetical protein